MTATRNVLGAFLVGALVMNMPSSLAVPATLEEWEAGTAGWTVTGTQAGTDCTVAKTGICSLKSFPQSSAGVSVRKSGLALPLTTTSAIGTSFRCNTVSGDTDFNLVVDFGQGGSALAHLTNGVGVNNGVSAVGSDGIHRVAGSWASANTWYEVRLHLNSLTDQTWVTLHTSGGALIGTSPPAPSPPAPRPSAASTSTAWRGVAPRARAGSTR